MIPELFVWTERKKKINRIKIIALSPLTWRRRLETLSINYPVNSFVPVQICVKMLISKASGRQRYHEVCWKSLQQVIHEMWLQLYGSDICFQLNLTKSFTSLEEVHTPFIITACLAHHLKSQIERQKFN